MQWSLKDERPIYLQLMEQISLAVMGGEYQPGERLPSVRELAASAGVNPNTMQRALLELEGMGLIRTQSTTGRFITDDAEAIGRIRSQLAEARLLDFLTAMQRLGCSPEQIRAMVHQALAPGQPPQLTP